MRSQPSARGPCEKAEQRRGTGRAVPDGQNPDPSSGEAAGVTRDGGDMSGRLSSLNKIINRRNAVQL